MIEQVFHLVDTENKRNIIYKNGIASDTESFNL